MLSSLIAPAGTLAGTLLGFLGARHLQARIARADRRRRLADAAGEVLAAAAEVQTALEAYRIQWTTWKSAWPAIAIAAAELLAADGRWRIAAPSALRVADRFRRDRDEAARAALTAPTARLATALITVSLLDVNKLRAAAHELREAVSELLPSVGSAAAWGRAANVLNMRVRDFREAVDQELHERKRSLVHRRKNRLPTAL